MQFEQVDQHHSINNDLLYQDKHSNQTKLIQNSIFINNENTQIDSNEHNINYGTG